MKTHVRFSALLAGLVAALLLRGTPADAQLPLSRTELQSIHAEVMVEGWESESLDHATLTAELARVASRHEVRRVGLGRSAEGRAITAYSAGEGPHRILFWSQAHGDAAIGTRALGDLLAFLSVDNPGDLGRLLLDSLTVVALPIVNPDGAEIGARRGSQGVDILLDASRRSTPEGVALARITEGVPATIEIGLDGALTETSPEAVVSVSVPAVEAGEAEPESRGRSLRVASHLASVLTDQSVAPVTRRQTPYDRRSFPDILQNSFRSVVLVGLAGGTTESEEELRRQTFTALLSLLQSLALRTLDAGPTEPYSSLPVVETAADPASADLLIRRARVQIPGLPDLVADIAFDFADPVSRTGGRVVDVGDLTLTATDTLVTSGLSVIFTESGLERGTRSGYRIAEGSPAEIDILRRTRTVKKTLYTTRAGTLTQPADYRFPRRARWFVSIYPPLLTQEFARHQEDAEVAFEETGWNVADVAEGSSRTMTSFQITAGRSLRSALAVELAAGMSDRWRSEGFRENGDRIEVAQSAVYAAALVSFEYRFLRVGGGPAFLSESWKWAGEGFAGGSDSGRATSPGLLWEASVALPAGTRWAPELRIQHRSFKELEVTGFGNIPRFGARHNSVSIGLGTTLRWWDER